ncbi:hypothetical protein [Krasilnikovia sp. MM14-A1259]|uniref:hypothetical protein n=1 Tax=Krasilnikovia sp. MM14-A1259 TaxID=3373539 RepID=UPI0037FAC949
MSSFAHLWNAAAEPIADATEEAATIKAAQTDDEEATIRLFVAYVPALRSALAHYVPAMPLDDARQAATLGFLMAIREHETARSERLAGLVRMRVHDALSEAISAAGGGFTVPARTLRRFFGILRAADGDAAEAARLAPAHQMTTETFYDVLAAVKADESLDLEMELRGADAALQEIVTPREITDVEDRILVEAAFRAVDDQERMICRLAYGFADYNPVPDAEIGHRIGYSRLKVQRTRSRALGKMRQMLCA